MVAEAADSKKGSKREAVKKGVWGLFRGEVEVYVGVIGRDVGVGQHYIEIYEIRILHLIDEKRIVETRGEIQRFPSLGFRREFPETVFIRESAFRRNVTFEPDKGEEIEQDSGDACFMRTGGAFVVRISPARHVSEVNVAEINASDLTREGKILSGR